MAVISNVKVLVQQQLKKFKSVFSRHKNLPSSLLPKITRYVRWELLCMPKNFGPRSWLSCHEARKRFLSHHIEDNKLPLNSRTYKTLKHILFEVFWNDKMEAMIIILFFSPAVDALQVVSATSPVVFNGVDVFDDRRVQLAVKVVTRMRLSGPRLEQNTVRE